ncbi:D-aminopeptidase [Pseudorhodobacter antarcticus]|uniref:D-aminopeptidase n=1 Tax=Pseudorhodobacter antarcticus TaxID=1077947 RepID=A0A1H8GTZ2_9RHOB|nr:P1 family peptidase [Pseudorhodobacter antarcticus]SEN47473.1 D-aminopeptidase [Pseudorhodobacter antarcticus]
MGAAYKTGPRNTITDVAGLRVGNASDAGLKSGVTVVTADAPFVASVHVMGGAPGTRETDLLAPDKTVVAVDALVLAGGSAFGLDACSGVVDGLRAVGRGFRVGDAVIPLVPGAILFDLLNGGSKSWAVNPYPALGRAAFDAAAPDFALGSVGAGTGALAAMHKGGLGSASLVLGDGTVVGALVAANPVGSVTTPGERHFWAASFEMGAEFGGRGPDPTSGHCAPPQSQKMAALLGPRSNTTIAIVATDRALTKAQCHRLAVAAHDGIARAVVPAHTPFDGDLVFALSTGNGAPASDAEMVEIGHATALCLSRAIARAVYLATPAAGDVLPCYQTN